jgi:hypothetical protein
MNLTPEEMEKHKDLIDESKKREETIRRNCEEAMENLSKLPMAFLSISDSMKSIGQGAVSIAESGEDAIEKMQSASGLLSSSLKMLQDINRILEDKGLAMAPEETFYRE